MQYTLKRPLGRRGAGAMAGALLLLGLPFAVNPLVPDTPDQVTPTIDELVVTGPFTCERDMNALLETGYVCGVDTLSSAVLYDIDDQENTTRRLYRATFFGDMDALDVQREGTLMVGVDKYDQAVMTIPGVEPDSLIVVTATGALINPALDVLTSQVGGARA